MVPLETTSDPLATLALGDIVVLPPAQSLTIRAAVRLPDNELGLTGFVAAGDLEVLLVSSLDPRDPLLVLQPVDYLPPQAADARILAEGAAAFWAPHLVSHAGGMGELYFRVLVLRGQITPMVLIYRGPELVVFVHVGSEDPTSVRALRMPRGEHETSTVARVAAVVEPLNVPLPTRTPARVPARTS